MYAVPQELADRFGKLYTGLYDPNQADGDIACACAEIDGMIGARYVTPVTAPAAAELLKNWALTLSEELVWSRSGKSELPPNVAGRVENVRKLLGRICDGTMRLPGAAELAPSESSGSPAMMEIETPVFGRNHMRRF